MRYLKKFSNYEKLNESLVVGAGMVIGIGIVWCIAQIYDNAKKFWSKHVIADKYNETGKTEIVTTRLPENISYVIPLSPQERESGVVETKLTQYEDDFGNVYWGYDHLFTDEDHADMEQRMASLDIYTAVFKEEDYAKLKSFLQNGERYSGKQMSNVPTPVEMIFREDWNPAE